MRRGPLGDMFPPGYFGSGAGSTTTSESTRPGGDAAATVRALAAQDIEAFKAAEMKEFRASLQAREAELLKVLAEEWKARDQEREMTLAHKAEE